MELNKYYTKYHDCRECDFRTQTVISLRNHFLSVHLQKTLAESREDKQCNFCERDYHRISAHISRYHRIPIFLCRQCEEETDSEVSFRAHLNSMHAVPRNNAFSEIESAFNRRVQTFERMYNVGEYQTLDQVYINLIPNVTKLIKHQLSIKFILRFSLILKCVYQKMDELGHIDEECDMFLRSNSRIVFLADKTSITKYVKSCTDVCSSRHEQIINSGSGWVLAYVQSAHIELGKIQLRGGCSSSKALIRVKKYKRKYLLDCDTKQNECFFNAVSLGLMSKQTHKLSSSARGCMARAYTKHHLITKKIKTPVSIKDIRKFERKNDEKLFGVNVFSYVQTMPIEDPFIIPVYRSINKHANKINLLLIPVNNQHHFIYIKDLNRLCDESHKRRFHCPDCLNSFTSIEALSNHRELCQKHEPLKIDYPRPGDQVQFKAHDKRILQGIIGFCDFESSLVPVSRMENAVRFKCVNCFEKGNPENCAHRTTNIHHQKPTTYSIILVDLEGKIIFERTESDEENLMMNFFNTLSYIEEKYYPLLQRYKEKKDYSPSEYEAHRRATKCYLCLEPFNPYDRQRIKVKDHCHFSNKFLGSAHSVCNWKRTRDKQIPIFIHNFQNYDSHFILQGLKYYEGEDKNISGIPLNMEKFRTLSIGKICFIDSLHLLPSNLGTLVENLKQSNHDFLLIDQLPHFNKFIKFKKRLLQKGIYPYEWASSVKKLEETFHFPSHKHFFNHLTQKNISVEEYSHGKEMFRIFKCKNMLDYCELYCRLDTVLLAEVIMEYRNMVKKEFDLDCTRYISCPQMAFDAMLKSLSSPIKLMSDPDMILMVSNNIRGGVSYINERYVKLNDNYFEDDEKNNFEDKKQDHLLYIDAINLYSLAQSSPMPIGKFNWCTKEEKEYLKENILNIDLNGDIGFFIECDIEYPSNHEKYSSLPLLPQHEIFGYDDISPYSQKCMSELRGKSNAKGYKSEKLVTNLKNKTKYVFHHASAQTALKAGLKITKLHRVIKFEQARILKPFIDFCTEKRLSATAPFFKMLFKLMMNSVYGKFLQDNRKHLTIKICTSSKLVDKNLSAVNYKGHRIISENVVCVFLGKLKVKMDRCIALAFTILNISKKHMQDTWYSYIQPNFGINNVSIVLSDTDSFLLHFTNISRNEIFDNLKECLDTSNYPSDHPLYHTNFKGKPGYFKDENAGHIMTEVIGLKSKCYVTKVINRYSKSSNENIICKGVGKAAKTNLTLTKYRECVQNIKAIRTNMFTIRSTNHKIFTQQLNKIALTTFDDKRWLLNCGLHSIPHHSNISTVCSICN